MSKELIKPFKFFTIEELTHTNTGLPNAPDAKVLYNLSLLINHVLDPARTEFKASIKVNSGYRSEQVNKAVKGVTSSQHLTGQAADISAGSVEENKKLFEVIKKLGVYDQLLDEKNYTWIHVSYSDVHNRKQILSIK